MLNFCMERRRSHSSPAIYDAHQVSGREIITKTDFVLETDSDYFCLLAELNQAILCVGKGFLCVGKGLPRVVECSSGGFKFIYTGSHRSFYCPSGDAGGERKGLQNEQVKTL